jgi:peptidoglycan/xylan/chitin deacetylase (PgdA/CDA1 family)
LSALVATAAGGACPGDPAAPATPRAVAVPEKGGVALGLVNYRERAALGDHELALTFDDGPDDEHTLQVLDILDRHCIRATFFLVGQEVDAAPDIARAIARRGHVIGAHSQTHPEDLSQLPMDVAEREIDQSFAAITRALASEAPETRARQARFFRFPELKDSPALLKSLAARDVTVIGADYGFDDWTDLPSAVLLQRAIAYTEERRRGVIVMHDYNPEMIAMLDTLITTLEAKGYRFVRLAPERD